MMRKLFGLLAAFALASAACADVLYWQVGNGDGTLTEDMQAYSYAQILATNDGGATRTVISSYLDPSDTAPATSVFATEMSDAGGFYAKLSGLEGDYTGYSFAVEIYNASGEALGHVGWATADSLSSAIVSQSKFNSNWTTMSSGFGASGWSSGAAAAPEPTSGLLMLLGAAMLGLRRKKVA